MILIIFVKTVLIKKNTKSLSTLNRLKTNYYNFNNSLLPIIDNIEIVENIHEINKCIKDKNVLESIIIIHFHYIYEKYIKYNSDIYDQNIYKKDQIYNKFKKCFCFIQEFKKLNIVDKDIINIIYKTKLSYNKLYELKGIDYEEFKEFLLEKEYIRENIDNNLVINKIYIKNQINKNNTQVLLNKYIGNKYYLLEIVNKYHDINNRTKIYDLFGGSLSVSNYFYKIYPNNNIIVNESNNDLYNLYKLVKNNENLLIKIFCKYNTLENIKDFNILINVYKQTDNINEKSVIYLILYIIGYNNYVYYDGDNNIKIFSLNNKYKNINKAIDLEEINTLKCFSKYLNNIEIHNHDILSNIDFWMKKIKPDDLVIVLHSRKYKNIKISEFKFCF